MLQVTRMHCADAPALLNQPPAQRLGHHDNAILIPFPASHDDLRAIKVQIAQPKVTALHRSKPGAV
jgi:hypothetical protein